MRCGHFLAFLSLAVSCSGDAAHRKSDGTGGAAGRAGSGGTDAGTAPGAGGDVAQDGGAASDGGPGGAGSGGGSAGGASSGGTSAGGRGAGGASPDGSIVPGSPTTGHTSGTRLRARLWDTLAGAELFREWVDTDLDAPCSFERASDDVLRCVPTGFGNLSYSDASCTLPVATPVACGTTGTYPLGKYLRKAIDEPRCDRQFQKYDVYLVGPEVLGPMYYVSSTGCRERSSSAAFRPLTPVDPTSLLAAIVEHHVIGEGLSVRVVTAADGAVQRLATVVSATDKACSPELFPGGTERCVNTDAARDAGDIFLSATCTGETVGVGGADDGCPPPSVVIRDLSSAWCPDEVTEVLGVGAEIDRTTVGDCGTVYGARHFRVGSNIPDTSFPEITEASLGTGPVRTRYRATPSGLLPLIPVGFWDVDLGRPCTVAMGPDGVTRCFPVNAISVGPPTTFSDAACTTGVQWHPTLCPGVTDPIAAFQSDYCATLPFSELRELSPYSGSLWFKNLADQCMASPAPATSHYSLGALIDPTRFTEVVERTE